MAPGSKETSNRVALTMINDGSKSGAGPVGQESEYSRVRDASLHGAGVGVATLAIKACLDVGSIAILARLLTPNDFGVVAMGGTVLNLLRIIGDWGLVMASTQRLQLSTAQSSALFWVNTTIGAALTLLSVAIAPLLALIFNEPQVVPITMVLSITVFAIGVGAQHEAIIRRRLMYSILHIIDVTSQAIGLVVGVVLSISGAGIWSLVAYQVVARLTRTGWLWIATRWIPSRPRRGVKIMDRLNYGTKLVPAQLLTHASRGLAEVLVGAGVGAGALGLYRRAHGIVMGVEQLKQPLKAMIPASLSRLQDRADEFSRFVLHSLTIWSIIACGTIGYVASEAMFVIRLLLGEQWLGAVPVLRGLAFAGLATAIGSATEWILLPRAEMRLLIALRIMRAGIVVSGVLVGLQSGVQGVAVGYSIGAFTSVVVELSVVSYKLDRALRNMWAPIVRALISAGIASAVVLMISDGVPFWVHVAEVLVYVVVFVVCHSVLPGGRAGIETLLRAVKRARHLFA